MFDRRIIGKWSYTGTEIGGIVDHETFELFEDGTFHLVISPTRYDKPFFKTVSRGNWTMEGERLIVTPTRVERESGVPSEGPSVKEGLSESHTYTLEWLSDDEWTSAEYRKYPSMKRVMECFETLGGGRDAPRPGSLQ